jgi:hypothetical protein
MAPDGEKVRQRRVAASSKMQQHNSSSGMLSSSPTTSTTMLLDLDLDDTTNPAVTTTPPSILASGMKCIPSVSHLQSNEMCIDGLVYDITDFQYHHPGGMTFVMFGGNDVTVQYKMIHPYHTTNNKQLLKMGPPVGIVQNYQSELRIYIYIYKMCIYI